MKVILKISILLVAAVALAVTTVSTSHAQSSGTAGVSATATSLGADVIVKGKGFTITQSELDDVYIRYSMSVAAEGKNLSGSEAKKVEAEMLSQLVLKKIILQKLTDEDRKEADKLAKDEMEHLLKMANGDKDKLRRKILAQGWKSLEEFSKNLTEIFQSKVFLERYIKVEVSKEDVRKYYESNQDLFTVEKDMFMGGFILFSKINSLTDTELTDEEWTLKKEAVKSVLQKAKDGENFDELMKKFSDDVRTRSRGATTVFIRGQLGQEVDDAAFALKDGMISDPVETPIGIFIIKMVKRTDAGLIPYGEIETKLTDQLREEQRRKEIPEITKKLETEFEVEFLKK